MLRLTFLYTSGCFRIRRYSPADTSPNKGSWLWLHQSPSCAAAKSQEAYARSVGLSLRRIITRAASAANSRAKLPPYATSRPPLTWPCATGNPFHRSLSVADLKG